MQIFFNMKKIQLLALFALTAVFTSCSDTVVVENRPDQSPTAPAISGYFKKNVLIEDYTGTWCGNCTRVAHAINLVKEQTDNVVTVAIHNGPDPYHFDGIAPLKNLILPNSPLALPVSRLNRMNVWTFSEVNNINEAVELTGNNTTLGLAMSSTLNNGTIDLTVDIKFLDNYSDLKLVVYLMENGLIYQQFNYTNYYDQYLIPNFEHNHVLRVSMTDILGDVITGTTNGSTVSKTFSIPVPANIANANNISFAAFVVGADNKAINAREAHINETQAFQINP